MKLNNKNILIKSINEVLQIASEQIECDPTMKGPLASGIYGAIKDNNLIDLLEKELLDALTKANYSCKNNFISLKELDDSLNIFEITKVCKEAINQIEIKYSRN